MDRRGFLKTLAASICIGISASIPISISDDKVITKPRTLKAEWTFDTAEDLKTFHGIDASEEIANLMAEEIDKEMNKN